MTSFRRALISGLLLPLCRGMDPADHQLFADELTPLLYSKPNECSSALGVSMAFSLVYPGTTGRATDQVREVMGFPAEGDDAHRQLVWEDITQELLSGSAGQCLQQWGDECDSAAPLLKIANSVWFDDGSSLKGEYEGIVGEYARQIDFEDAKSPVTVNEWVEDSTNGLIDKIVDESQPLFPPYVLLAVNSIYLKARWEEQFKDRNNNLDSFYDSPAKTSVASEAHFMNTVGYFDYSHEALPGYQVIDLPFAGSGRLSMIFVLPANISGNLVPSAKVIAALGDLKSSRVALSLPKFKFESTYDDGLKEGLMTLGVTDPFAPGTKALCDMFDDESWCEKLVVDKVVQKTVIDVNEEGVEAAAVTVVGVGLLSAPPFDENAVTLMVLDHPFQFFVYDATQGLVLFEGRLGKPEVPEEAPSAALYDARHSDGDFWTKRFGVDPVPAARPPFVVLNPGDCPEEGQCLDPSNGKCTFAMADCLVDPCEVTEECSSDQCTPNYCGGCHAVCATGIVSSDGAPFVILNPDDCPEEGQCRDPSNGKCTFAMADCLVDPCEVTEECSSDQCTPNYCGGCHAVCATGAVSTDGAPFVVLNPGDCPEEGQCRNPSNGKCTFAMADCLVDPCEVTEECSSDQCTPNYCGGCHAVCATGTVSSDGAPLVVLNPDDCPEEGQCRDPSNGKCTFAMADCLIDPCEATEECSSDQCTPNYCGGCHAVCATGTVTSDSALAAEADGPPDTTPPTAAGSSATQSTQAAGSSATQSTQAADSSTTTEPTDAEPSDPEPSSGNVSNKQSLALCACILLVLTSVFV